MKEADLSGFSPLTRPSPLFQDAMHRIAIDDPNGVPISCSPSSDLEVGQNPLTRALSRTAHPGLMGAAIAVALLRSGTVVRRYLLGTRIVSAARWQRAAAIRRARAGATSNCGKIFPKTDRRARYCRATGV